MMFLFFFIFLELSIKIKINLIERFFFFIFIGFLRFIKVEVRIFNIKGRELMINCLRKNNKCLYIGSYWDIFGIKFLFEVNNIYYFIWK